MSKSQQLWAKRFSKRFKRYDWPEFLTNEKREYENKPYLNPRHWFHDFEAGQYLEIQTFNWIESVVMTHQQWVIICDSLFMTHKLLRNINWNKFLWFTQGRVNSRIWNCFCKGWIHFYLKIFLWNLFLAFFFENSCLEFHAAKWRKKVSDVDVIILAMDVGDEMRWR